MKEYIRVWDNSDNLEEVNGAAAQGWHVVACFTDDRRGTQFILERAAPVGVHSSEPTRQPFA